MLRKKFLTKENNPLIHKQRRDTRFLIKTMLISLLLFVSMFGCKKDDYEGEIKGICPLVISTDPADKAVSVVASEAINATFNKSMDPTTIDTKSFILMQGSTPILGAVTSVPCTTVSGYIATFAFTPASVLAPFTLYTATMKKGVRDPMRNALQEDYVWSFTTQPQLLLSSNPETGGTTTGGGLFDVGTSITAKAVAAAGYTFKNWTEDAIVVSSNANFTFNITKNRTLVANFTAIAPTYTVSVSSNPLLGGTTSGGGSFNSGASVTVKAVPAAGYTFTNWKEGVNIVSNNANYTFIITANRNLVANFTAVVIPPVGPANPDLKSAGDFSILTMSGISSVGVTSVQGNIGVSPAAAAAITGFGLIMDVGGQSSHTTIATHVTGKVYASDYSAPTPSKLTVAIVDMQAAYTSANNLVTPAPVIDQGAGNVGGLTLAPGLYKWSTGVLIASGTTLTLSGGANDTWVFQIAQDLTLFSTAKVNLIGGAQAKNITWVVAGQAVLGTDTVLYGNILSKTLISLNTGAKVTGGLYAQTAVTLNTSTVVKP